MKNPTLPVNTRILFLFTLLYTAVASVQSIHATTITVINTNDSGSGSLRQALSDANNGDTIDFDSSLEGQIITLTSGQLLVNRSVGISGLGADNLTVDGNANDRVFYINPNNTVTISGLTITNGVVVGDGAGIYNDRATLTVSNCTVSDNSGSGIFNLNAELTVSNCTISGNSGGGIFNYGFSGSGTATLTITNSTLSGNSASQGGGIYNVGGFDGITTLTIGDTILNAGALGENIYNEFGTVSSLGYNLSSDNGSG